MEESMQQVEVLLPDQSAMALVLLLHPGSQIRREKCCPHSQRALCKSVSALSSLLSLALYRRTCAVCEILSPSLSQAAWKVAETSREMCRIVSSQPSGTLCMSCPVERRPEYRHILNGFGDLAIFDFTFQD